MESSACRGRASDAEQPAWSWSYSATAECEPAMVKEEPEWGECGVSEAAAAEGLYDGHEVKDEVIIGPEVMQKQDVAYLMQNALNRTEEGPRRPNPQGGVDSTPVCTHNCPGDGPRCNMSHKQQLKLRSCSVRLERILMEGLPTCNTCLMIFDCKLSLQNHSCTHSVETPIFYKEACDETAKTYIKSDNYGKRYLKKGHLVKRCLATYSEILLQHSSNGVGIVNADEKSYSDNVSESQSKNQSVLVSHTGKKPSSFKCDICSDLFTRHKDLIKHVTIMHIHSFSIKPKMPKLYKCHICQKYFAARKSLIVHKRTHTGEKPFSCDVCKAQFKYRSCFVTHKRTHTGEKAFSCEVCELRFMRKSYLYCHERIHAGEKPFSCDVCKLQFGQGHHLVEHKRIHTGEKPF